MIGSIWVDAYFFADTHSPSCVCATQIFNRFKKGCNPATLSPSSAMGGGEGGWAAGLRRDQIKNQRVDRRPSAPRAPPPNAGRTGCGSLGPPSCIVPRPNSASVRSKMGKRQRTSYFATLFNLIEALPPDLQEIVYSHAHGRARLQSIKRARMLAAEKILACWTRHRFRRRGYRRFPIIIEI